MTQQVTHDKLYSVIAQVFGIPKNQINEDSSPDTIPSWDSLGHINLILAVETEFAVSLTPENAMEMLSVRLIRIILEEFGVKDFS